VALALVPTAALVTMSLVAGDLAMSLAALRRFGLEVALVLVGSGVVFEIKRLSDHRRSVD
jgi:O-antigen ligase